MTVNCPVELVIFLLAVTKCLTKRLKEGFTLAHSLEGDSPSWWGKHGGEREKQRLTLSAIRKQGVMNAGARFSFSLLSSMETLVCEMGKSSISGKPLWKHPHRRTQRCVSQVTLNPGRSTGRFNYHRAQRKGEKEECVFHVRCPKTQSQFRSSL